MNWSATSLLTHGRQYRLAYFFLGAGLLLAGWIAARLGELAADRDQIRFQAACEDVFDSSRALLKGHLELLKVARGMFLVSPLDGLDDARAHFQAQDLLKAYPGLHQLGWALRVPESAKERHVEETRRRGLPSYEVLSAAGHSEYFPALIVASVPPAQRPADGMDLRDEPSQIEAMEQARDSGEPVATALSPLPVSVSAPAGFTVFLPVYRGGHVPPTTEERRAALEGYVFARYWPQLIWPATMGQGTSLGVKLRVFDGDQPDPGRRLYGEAAGFESPPGSRTLAQAFDVLGRRWLFHFTSQPGFELSSEASLPVMALVSGSSISLLLFGLIWIQIRARISLERMNQDLHRQGGVLQESEMRLRALVGSIDEIVFECDGQGRISKIWTSNEKLLRRSQEEWVGSSAGELLGEELMRPLGEAFARVAASRMPENMEFSLEIQGEQRWFLARVSPIARAEEAGSSLCVLARDITGRKRDEQALVQSQMRLRISNRILAAQREGQPFSEILAAALGQLREYFPQLRATFSVIDAQQNLTVQTASEPAGWPSLTGRALDLARAPEYREALQAGQIVVARDILEDPRLAPLAELLAAHGRRAVLDVPVRLAGGGVGVLTLDSPKVHSWSENERVTLQEAAEYLGWASQRHHAEQQREQAEKALAAEKERLSVTLSSIGDGVITTDTAGRIILLNRVAEKMTGWKQSEAVGRDLAEVFHLLDEATRQRAESPVDRVLAGGEIFGQTSQALLQAQDGAERLISNSGALVFDADGKVVGVVLVFRDITDQQKLEAELLRASRIESLGLLAGGLAHDFNNILTGILGNVSLAKILPQQEDIQERLELAEKACLRARDLTHQLLKFARGGSPVKSAAAVAELIRESADLVLSGSSVRCDLVHSADLWPVEVDAIQIKQVIGNLVLNAAEAMPEGGVVKVLTSNEHLSLKSNLPLPAGRYVRIAIEDRGKGIRPEDLPKIFDPYFTTKQRASGLGLATAYVIVKKHGGLIVAESKLGAGSRFEIYLPAAAQAPSATSPVLPGLGAEAGRILVMDDDPLILNLAKTVLSRLGHIVEVAHSGEEALRCFEAAQARGEPFEAVILDLTVPGGWGARETLKKLVAIDPKVKAIVSSGYTEDRVMSDYREFGFSAAVTKPYFIGELAKVLHQVLRKEIAEL